MPVAGLPELDWAGDLAALVDTRVLPALPPPHTVRAAADSVLSRHDAAWRAAVASGRGATASSASAGGGGSRGHGVLSPGVAPPGLLFPSQQLFEAVEEAVRDCEGVPQRARAAAALCVASALCEDKVRRHSTKAVLVAAQRNREAEAAAAQRSLINGGGGGGGAASSSGGGGAAGGDGGDGSGAGGEDEETVSFIATLGEEEAARELQKLLGEDADRLPFIRKLVGQHGPVGVSLILKRTLEQCRSGDTGRADGAGSKSLGGVFFREAKRFKHTGEVRAVEEELPDLPPMRGYQAVCVAAVLRSWGMELPPEGFGDGRGWTRQQDERAACLAGDWERNWLVSAPTNSGKTRMFIEVARGVLAARGRAVVVVLVPNVLLTAQHAAYFKRSALPGTLVEAFSSANPLTAQKWRLLVGGAARYPVVVVATAQSFYNLLRAPDGQVPVASLSEVDLLVLDEAHHCKDEHPYAKVMELYDDELVGSCRVLACTASPASEESQIALALRMGALLSRLRARLHVVDDSSAEVAAVVPEPRQIVQHVEVRAVDEELMGALQAFALDAALDLAAALRQVKPEGLAAEVAHGSAVRDLVAAVRTCAGGPYSGAAQTTKLDPLGQWIATGRKLAGDYGCSQLELVCRLLDVLRKATELLEDAGFEGVLPFLGRKCAVLCREEGRCGREAAMVGAAGYRMAAALGAAPPPATATRGRMLAAVAAAAGTPGASGSSPPAAEPRLLAQLRQVAAAAPSAAAVAARDTAARQAAGKGGPPPGNSCPDIPLKVSQLVARLLGTVAPAAGPPALGFLSGDVDAAMEVVRDCFVSGVLKDHTFPKYWALLKYLQGFSGREQFHGIVFVKTRQAVFYLSDLVRRTRQLDFVEVLELIGHSSNTRRDALAPEQDRHGRGMDDAMQQQVLQLFKSPGRKVLIATSAAEEGMDVPSCEFVVRYNAPATGIQLLQSRGRARQKVSEFLVLLQRSTLDVRLHAKSQREEENMRQYAREHLAASR